MILPQILLTLFLVLVIGLMSVHFIQIMYYNSAPFLPSKKEIPQKIIKNIECKNGSTVYELGCGTGTFLKTLKKNYPHKELKLVGVENFILSFILLKIQNKLFRYNIEIKKEDIFQTDLSGADMIYCFLNKEAMQKLKPKIFSECRPGTLIFSYQFSLPQTTPQRKINYTQKDRIFIYQI